MTGERLKYLISLLDTSQKKFSEILQISPSAVTNWIKNEREISPSNMELIHEKFNVSKEWLRDGIGEVFVSDVKEKCYGYFIEKTEINKKLETLKKEIESVNNYLQRKELNEVATEKILLICKLQLKILEEASQIFETLPDSDLKN